MSTKIYNGFQFSHRNFFALNTDVLAWRSRVEQLTDTIAAEVLANMVVKEVDEMTSKNKPIEERILGRKITEIRDRQKEIKTTGHRDPVVDFDFSFTILPYENRYYGIYYTEQREMEREFKELPWVKDFSYWDNTDRPDDMCEIEWEHRSAVWDKIFAKTSVPGQLGYSVECTHRPHWGAMVDLVHKFVPSFETRARERAKLDVLDYYFSSHWTKCNPELMTSRIMPMYHEAMDWLTTDEGQELYQQRYKDLLPGLVEITKDFLIDR